MKTLTKEMQMAITPSKALELLEEGNKIFIPADTPHEAINTSDSLMLSIGFEKFLIDKI